ncbi:MAG: hypothetical protein V1711_03140 [bacterium]
MDEILIEEKKYISSKRAAKITGYAKDYVGQLCREGRVPARLVGRSWYVLEAAIQDHRFGTSEDIGTFGSPEIEPEKKVELEAPRYEASSKEILPSVNRLRVESSEPIDTQKKELDEASQNIQDSWREWFDRFDQTEKNDIEPENQTTVETDVEVEEQEDVAVDIPIHTVSRTIPAELLPNHLNEQREELMYDYKEQKGRRTMVKTIQMGGVLLAVVIAAVAAIGTGYFDEYIISNGQARFIAGVALYNK